MPAFTSDDARCGPTPFTYWTGARRSIRAIIPRGRASEGPGRLELDDGPTRLEAHVPHRVGQPEGRAHVEALRVRGRLRGRGEDLGEHGERHGVAGDEDLLELDVAESVRVRQPAPGLDGDGA